MKTVGQAAYDKWAELVGPNFPGPMTAWKELPAGAKTGWEEVAAAAVHQYLDNEGIDDTANRPQP
jgi:hypothetical protein